ncbi:AI-2E family transporter [Geotalea sp. SG265]|uniref:AI-2E family transporter n=1 Tax=Geotalea sp. SG265 TaxID=2922867 RepID=UPI001FAEDCD0|nr:AI-2E family transporter [Geotalea sp. SG265]
MDKRIFLTILAALATAGIIVLLGLLAAPILEPLAWALVIGVATIPYYKRLLRRFPRHPGRMAGSMVLAVTVCFILPTAGLIVAIAQSAPDWVREAERMVQTVPKGPAVLHRIPFIDHAASLVERAGIDLGSYVSKYAGALSGAIVNGAANMAKGLVELLFSLAVSLFILFFIYRDGERVVATVVDRFGDEQDQIKRYLHRFQMTTTAVAVGTLFTCLIQGITAGIGYFFAGVPAPVLFGGLTAIAALVPVVGTGVVWVPLVVLVAIKGTYLKAGLLALWCLVLVGLADNAIRPLAVGAKGDVPVLAVVLGAICGVTTIGLLGLILGPIIFATVINLWHEEAGNYHDNPKVLL